MEQSVKAASHTRANVIFYSLIQVISLRYRGERLDAPREIIERFAHKQNLKYGLPRRLPTLPDSRIVSERGAVIHAIS